MAGYSFVIKNGMVIDGTGRKMYAGDVGIAGEKIKHIGSILSSGERTIDASGKYIMPGVIDITNHSDTHWTLFNYPSQDSLLRQGITTIIGGTCGSSLAPLTDVSAIRSIQKWADISKININWRGQKEFFKELSRHSLGVNFGTFVGHGTLRRDIIQDQTRPLEKAELESIKLLLRRSLDEGAFGLSLGLAYSHGRTVPQEELIALAKVVHQAGKLVTIHIRNEGRRILSSVVETINIARLSGARVHISHLKAIGRKAWEDLPKTLHIIEKARKDDDIDIHVDFFPYLRTGSLLYTLLPEWAKEGGKENIITILKDPHKRKAVIESLESQTLHFDRIVIASTLKDKTIIGKRLDEIASDIQRSPEETMLELLANNELNITIFGRTLLGKNIIRIAREPFSMFASDGVGEGPVKKIQQKNLAHPRSFGAAPRFLARLVRKGKILTWEEAVNKMTLMPSTQLGLEKSRGKIQKGFYADLVIFNPETINDTSTYFQPRQSPNGIEYVFVNGKLAIEKENNTEALAGKILQRG